jgi:DHA2 family multidrug resistance protein-like MFS transporter
VSSTNRLAIVAVSFGTALVAVDGAIVPVALPTIAAELGVEQSSVVSIITAYQVVLLATLLPLASLGDLIGHRRLYQAGQLLFIVAAFLCLFVETLTTLIAVRMLQALATAAVLSVSAALIRSIYPPDKLGRGLAINVVAVSVSNALAPTIGGAILTLGPWTWLFVGAAPFAFLSLLLGRSLPKPVSVPGQFDLRGAALFAIAVGLLVVGLNLLSQGALRQLGAAAIVLSLPIGYLFVRRELGLSRPIVPVDLLRRPVLALSTIGAVSTFVASMIVLTSLPFRLELSFGFAPLQVGGLMAFWALASMISAPLAGMLSDRIPAGVLGGAGMALATAAFLNVAGLTADTGRLYIGLSLFFCGASLPFFLTPNLRLILSNAPTDRVASAGGLVSTARMTGQTLGATLAAGLLAMGLGAGPAPATVAAVLAVIAGLCSVARLSQRIRNT